MCALHDFKSTGEETAHSHIMSSLIKENTILHRDKLSLKSLRRSPEERGKCYLSCSSP